MKPEWEVWRNLSEPTKLTLQNRVVINLISKVLHALSTDVNQLVANSHFRIQRNKVKNISWQYFLLQWFGLFYWPVQSILPFDGDNSSGFGRFKVLCSDQCGSNSRTESSFVIGWLVASDLIDKHKRGEEEAPMTHRNYRNSSRAGSTSRRPSDAAERPANLLSRHYLINNSGRYISRHDWLWLQFILLLTSMSFGYSWTQNV